MLPRRESGLHEASMRRVEVFLEWMNGGFNNIQNITVVGATNLIETMESCSNQARQVR